MRLLISSLDFTFQIYLSLISSWYRFHNEEKEVSREDMQQNEQDKNDYEELSSAINQGEYSHLDCNVESRNEGDENFENKSFDSSSVTEILSEEEQLKAFEKRLLHLLLTLQMVFHTSEAAINFVVTSLMELFLSTSMKNLVCNLIIIKLIYLESSL